MSATNKRVKTVPEQSTFNSHTTRAPECSVGGGRKKTGRLSTKSLGAAQSVPFSNPAFDAELLVKKVRRLFVGDHNSEVRLPETATSSELTCAGLHTSLLLLWPFVVKNACTGEKTFVS